jgi:tRNA (guanine26-N2/guanine27-N2)-dimethyltransferase
MTRVPPSLLQQEGQAKFNPGQAFYRPGSQIARDFAVLVAALYRQQNGRLRVLDAMTGCGIRPLRYVLEAGADWVWANEANQDLAEVLTDNLAALPAGRYRITHQDANQLFFACYQQRDFYDLVDIDNFGGPAPFTSTGMWAVRLGGMLYLTNTDGRSSSGHDPERSLKLYPAFARSHPAVHEQGVRLLLGHAAREAAARGLGIEPVFSLFTGQVHRVMVRLVNKPTLTSKTYGFVAYCHGCGHFQTVNWRHLGRVVCPCQETEPSVSKPGIVLSGPLWLGALHQREMVEAMRSLAQEWGWSHYLDRLTVMAAEADLPPYYYPLREIGRLGKMDIPNRDDLVAALQQQGYRATLTSLDWQAIKTNASFGQCLALAKQLHEST